MTEYSPSSAVPIIMFASPACTTVGSALKICLIRAGSDVTTNVVCLSIRSVQMSPNRFCPSSRHAAGLTIHMYVFTSGLRGPGGRFDCIVSPFRPTAATLLHAVAAGKAAGHAIVFAIIAVPSRIGAAVLPERRVARLNVLEALQYERLRQGAAVAPAGSGPPLALAPPFACPERPRPRRRVRVRPQPRTPLRHGRAHRRAGPGPPRAEG